MDLPHASKRQKYTDEIKTIEHLIKGATSGAEVDGEALDFAQQKLDNLATDYQYDEHIGTARFKLYELQALIHYYNGDTAAALNFVDQAVDVKGDSYTRAEELREQITYGGQPRPPVEVTQREPVDQKLVGVKGWLTFFLFTVVIGILVNLVSLGQYPQAFSDLASYQNELPSLASSTVPLLLFEIFGTLGYIAALVWCYVLVVQRKRFAVTLVVCTLAIGALLGIIDYIWAAAVFSQYDVNLSEVLDGASGDIARSIIGCMIWIPYFLISRRVKATLTN